MAERIYVTTEQLAEGMITEQEIMNSNGVIMIARGTELDPFMIQSIENMGLTGIYVSLPEDEENEDAESDGSEGDIETLDIQFEDSPAKSASIPSELNAIKDSDAVSQAELDSIFDIDWDSGTGDGWSDDLAAKLGLDWDALQNTDWSAAEGETTEPLPVEQIEDPKVPHPPAPARISPLIERKINKIKVPDRAKVELSEQVKQQAERSVSYLFANTDAADFSKVADNVTQDLMRTILENDAIAVDVEALKVSDEYTFKHSVDVATIAMIIGKMHGLDNKEVYDLGIAGLLHDIGKSRIPSEILNKPGPLTEEEFKEVKKHSYYSYEIIRHRPEFNDKIKTAVLEHHEKLNNSGYPMKLGTNSISLYARILAIADIYDALVSERPYKKAYSKRDAIEIILSMSRELDLDIMRTFMKCVILYPVGSQVYLSNGEWARVVENNPNFILRPKVVGLTSGTIYDLARDIKCASIVVQD